MLLFLLLLLLQKAEMRRRSEYGDASIIYSRRRHHFIVLVVVFVLFSSYGVILFLEESSRISLPAGVGLSNTIQKHLALNVVVCLFTTMLGRFLVS